MKYTREYFRSFLQIARYGKNFGAIKIADEPKVVGFVQTK
jgi:hypothetical protein